MLGSHEPLIAWNFSPQRTETEPINLPTSTSGTTRYSRRHTRERSSHGANADDERTEIAQNLFSSMRVRDGDIISARLAREEYLPLVASAEARVWMARPEGFEPPTC